MTGRTLAVVAELGVDLQPAGWRLTDARRASTTDGRGRCWRRTSTRSRSRPRATTGRSRSRSPGRGRWPRPSRGRAATRSSPTSAPAASWPRRSPRACATTSPTYAAGCPAPSCWSSRSTSRRCRRCWPAQVPTASGFGRHRSVHPPERVRGPGVGLRAPPGGRRPWHTAVPPSRRSRCCVGPAPGDVGRPDVLAAAAYDALGERARAGETGALLGVVPSTSTPATAATDSAVTERVLTLLDMLGLDPAEVADQLVLTPACGLAGASPSSPGPCGPSGRPPPSSAERLLGGRSRYAGPSGTEGVS